MTRQDTLRVGDGEERLVARQVRHERVAGKVQPDLLDGELVLSLAGRWI